MSDDFNTDTVPVSPPSEQPSPAPAPDTSEIINERRHIALSQLAKKEDVTDFVAEREDQAAAIDRGEDLPQERQNQWFRRASKALQDATLEAQGIDVSAQQGQEPQQPPPGYIAGDEAMREIENARKTGAAALRVQQYFGDNQERKQQIIDWHQSMDPESKVASWIIENESQFAPQIMERLADNPEALQQIAEMPPHQRDRWLGMLEGNLAAEMRFAQQLSQQQQQWQQDRRTTRTPPPIRPPRGSASVPQDIHQLAGKNDVSDYVKCANSRRSGVTEYFNKVRGALSCYCDDNDGMLTDARFVLCRLGEDADLVCDAFWKEYEGSQVFSIIPLFARGEAPPRRELCTQQSLLDALRRVRIEPGSMIEMKWKKLCEDMHVAWPKRLAA